MEFFETVGCDGARELDGVEDEVFEGFFGDGQLNCGEISTRGASTAVFVEAFVFASDAVVIVVVATTDGCCPFVDTTQIRFGGETEHNLIVQLSIVSIFEIEERDAVVVSKDPTLCDDLCFIHGVAHVDKSDAGLLLLLLI